MAPWFEGSAYYRVLPVPNLDLRYKRDKVFISARDGVGATLLEGDGFKFGPILRYRFARNDWDGPGLYGMGGVPFTVEGGGFARYDLPFLSAKVEVRRGLGGSNGLVFDALLDGKLRLADNFFLSGGPRLSVTDSTFNQAYFGVNYNQSQASGYAQYFPGAGLRSVGLGTSAVWRITDQLNAVAFGAWNRLTDVAAASPIVTAANVAGDAERAELATIVAEYVDPQIKRYYEAVSGSYRGKAREVPGLCSAPNGAELYKVAIRAWTGLRLDPKELHEIGLQEWADIQEEMKVISTKLGHGGSIEKLRDAAESDPTNVAATKEALIARIKEDIERGYAAAGKVFGRFPKAGCDVKAVEEFKEKDAPAAYYFGPAADGSRPGTYYVNLYDLKDMSKTELEALAYHEGIPGHHLQRAVQTDPHLVGHRVGMIQLANILGNSLGGLIAGLVLLRLFGTAGTLVVLLAAGAHLPGLVAGDERRIALEAYPGYVARRITRASYKADRPALQTPARQEERERILDALMLGNAGLQVQVRLVPTLETTIAENGTGDLLDAVICAAQAAQAVRPQLLVPGFGQWQAQGQLAQRLQVQLLGLHLGAARVLASGVADLHPHIAAGPGQALLVHKGQAFGADRPASAVVLARDAARELGKAHLGQLLVQAQAHLAQVQVGGAAGPAGAVSRSAR